ncbi:MAG: hypothetical protein MUO26_09535 [Methanotrichaceae archaeon]|nr:hypothetical protein [Methanotrichaceae archaeon]
MTSRRETAIFIPSSLTMETRDRRLNTLKIGLIARAAAVFRVDRIVVYKDPEYNDFRFISMVLRYIETPQYLRRMLIPRKEELKHVGMLPPLRTVHHPVNSKTSALRIGEFRVGAVVESVGSDKGVWVEIGVDRPIPLSTGKSYKTGQRLNVGIFSLEPLAAEPVERNQIPCYWGYETEVAESLERRLEDWNGAVLLTSNKGRCLTPEILQSLEEIYQKDNLAVIFGSPARGVDAFLSRNALERYDMINTIPYQGTETVRVEEATFATLALLNLVRQED